MYYVYVLKSLKDGKYYFGQTANVEKKLKLHNSGRVLSTKYRAPFALVGFKTFENRNQARWFEYLTKKHGDRKKKLIKEVEASGPLGRWPNGLRPGGR